MAWPAGESLGFKHEGGLDGLDVHGRGRPTEHDGPSPKTLTH